MDPKRGRAVAARLKEFGVKGIFDEAHLLFDGASKPFVESITQTVALAHRKRHREPGFPQSPKRVTMSGNAATTESLESAATTCQ